MKKPEYLVARRVGIIGGYPMLPIGKKYGNRLVDFEGKDKPATDEEFIKIYEDAIVKGIPLKISEYVKLLILKGYSDREVQDLFFEATRRQFTNGNKDWSGFDKAYKLWKPLSPNAKKQRILLTEHGYLKSRPNLQDIRSSSKDINRGFSPNKMLKLDYTVQHITQDMLFSKRKQEKL